MIGCCWREKFPRFQPLARQPEDSPAFVRTSIDITTPVFSERYVDDDLQDIPELEISAYAAIGHDVRTDLMMFLGIPFKQRKHRVVLYEV